MTSRRSATRRVVTVVRPLGHGEAALAGDVLADSHADYPSFAHLFADPARRRILRSFFTGVARDAVPFGAVDGAWSGSRMMAVAPTRARAFFALGANAERAFPDGAHWYLEVLGVRAEAQGQGFGRRLLEAGLARVDATGLAGHLETADRAHVAFYERFGFAFERELQLIPDGPPHWTMRRPAAGSDPVRAGHEPDESEVRR